MTDEKIYEKYSHIVRGSIEEVPKGTPILCGKNHKITSHGKICIIKCSNPDDYSDCLKTRIINVQDARQVTMCKNCTIHQRNMRRRVKNK